MRGGRRGPKTRNRAEEDEEGRGRRGRVLKRLDSLMVEEAAGGSQRGGACVVGRADQKVATANPVIAVVATEVCVCGVRDEL